MAEAAQNYEPMVMANPDPPAEPAFDTEGDLAKHLQRPAPPEPTVRQYNDQATGEQTPDNQTIDADRASRDLTAIREAEALEIRKESNSDLHAALDYLQQEEETMRAVTTPQPAQPPQPDGSADVSPQPEREAQWGESPPQPDPVQAADPAYDAELAQALSSPKVRAVLQQVNQEVEATKAQFRQATAQVAQEASALIGVLYPEFAGMNSQQMQGALAVMAQTQPERVQQLRQLAGRTQNILAAQQQQQAQEQAQQRQQYQENLARYEEQEIRRYETLIARDRSPEQIRALRENVFPMIEKHYGIPQASMRDLYTGAAPVSGAEFMRSSAFQLLVSDALSYRMSKEAVGRAVSRPIPNVQRPGSSAEALTRTEEALASAQAKLKPSMSAKEAAAYVIARRAAR
jgi:hypothetical protein